MREGARRTRGMRVAAGAVASMLLVAGVAISAEIPASGTIDLSTDSDALIAGARNLGEAGWTVAPAGDVNGDGIADMLIGARLADPSDRKNAGAAYVVFGSKQLGKTIDLGNLGTGGFRIDGAVAGDQASVALASAGDVNGDGLADILVGAPGFDRADNAGEAPDPQKDEPFGHPRGAGAVFVVYGRKQGDIDLANFGADAGFRITGATPGDELGAAVASVGDMNGDGLREIAIGAPRHAPEGRTESGGVYVLFGRAAGDVDLAAPGSLDFQLFEGPDGSMAGLALAALDDMNKDGVPELAVGAPRTPPGGATFVVFGRNGAQRGDLGSPAVPGFTVTGAAGEFLGVSLGAAGDLNGDGAGDLAIGAPLADRNERPDSGSVYVVFGKPDDAPVDAGTLGPWGYRIDGVSDNDGTGSAEGSAGDFNADGRNDLLIGATFAGALSREQAGAAYVVYPQPAGTALDLGALQDQGIRLAGAHPGDHTRSVALAGDVDGDGVGDLLIGANRLETGPADKPLRTGGAYLVLAPHPKPPPTPDPGAVEEVKEDKCVASTNIEAVIDDSGSMFDTDSGRLRKRALELILAKPRNEGKVLGAEEFGDPDADVLIPPEPIPNAGDKSVGVLLKKLDALIQADNGGTDYNLAFGSLADANPGATARIFLTDGAHNAGEYRDLHRGGPPTFVIGLGIGRKGPDAARLQRIADETEGRYFPAATGATLPPILDAIDSRLNCDLSLDHYVEPAIEDDEQQTESTELDQDTYSADVSVSWDDPEDGFEIDELELIDDESDPGEAARASAARVIERVSGRRIKKALVEQGKGVKRRPVRAGKLTLTGSRGRGYLALRVRGVHGAAKLRVTVRARKVRGKARLSTHVTQSRRRR